MQDVITEMFWVAEYNNGLALPEFDEFTGRVNSFSHVDHKNVIRFWWLPITPRMTQIFPNTRYNPLLKRYCVDLNGSKGYVSRRVTISLAIGGKKDKDILHSKVKDLFRPQKAIKCYILGIEKGPRREIYPNGTIKDIEWTDMGETQELLHG
jgi:hypothetical protein